MAKKLFPKRKRLHFKNEDKQIYFREWIRGYKDSHAGNNLVAAQHEYDTRRKQQKLKSWQHADYKGYISGLKAQLRDLEKGIYDHRNHE